MNKLIIGCGILTFALASCQSKQNQEEETLAVEKAKQELRDSLELDSFRRVDAAQQGPAIQQTGDQKAIESQQAYSTEPKGTYEQTSNTTTPSSQPIETKKKGWSDAAKGTAIGAGVGAGVGALIDKDKRLRGAAIGAAIGAGGGYVIGRKSDKKSGRAQ